MRVESLIDAIELMDAVALSYADQLKGVDVNPILVTDTEATVVDALIVPG